MISQLAGVQHKIAADNGVCEIMRLHARAMIRLHNRRL